MYIGLGKDLIGTEGLRPILKTESRYSLFRPLGKDLISTEGLRLVGVHDKVDQRELLVRIDLIGLSAPGAIMSPMVAPKEGSREPKSEPRAAEVQRVEEIWDSYQPTVLNLFRRRRCARELAEDLTQQVFIRVWKNRDKLHSIRSLPSWLKTIAIGVWQNHLRDSKAAKRGAPTMSLDQHLAEEREVAISNILTSDGSSTDDPAERAAARLEIEAVKKDLATLPPKQRQVLRLVGVQGFSNGETAKILGITVNTVKSHVSQGRRRLRELQEERDRRRAAS